MIIVINLECVLIYGFYCHSGRRAFIIKIPRPLLTGQIRVQLDINGELAIPGVIYERRT